ncbi:sigma-E factor negative regulatory protein [Kangiella sp. HZ709]|uniref:sigma-E factor negative regulatory protein n=1 Tax=Kangiella sp. HZ709 TaxID=2666328 RepID=UPI0012B0A2F1|nr:RseA family anti-sigma factor [Kangiella sp. HZ709]MRX27352.1 hypothetical protein [Kangiella sp. HZ709]
MVFDSKQMASKFLDGDLMSNSDVTQLIADKKTKQTFSRYQMIRSFMHNNAVTPDVCIADSVMSALSHEATVLSPQFETESSTERESSTETKLSSPKAKQSADVVSLPNRFLKPLGGMAIAASVALVALINLGNPALDVTNTANGGVVLTQASAPAVDREQLQQAHSLFTEIANSNTALPVIQTVSNQQAVAIKVPVKVSTNEPLTQKQTKDKAEADKTKSMDIKK